MGDPSVPRRTLSLPRRAPAVEKSQKAAPKEAARPQAAAVEPSQKAAPREPPKPQAPAVETSQKAALKEPPRPQVPAVEKPQKSTPAELPKKPKGPAYTPPKAPEPYMERFWLVMRASGKRPKARHASLELAQQEAQRIAAAAPGQDVWVIEARTIETINRRRGASTPEPDPASGDDAEKHLAR